MITNEKSLLPVTSSFFIHNLKMPDRHRKIHKGQQELCILRDKGGVRVT